MIGTLRNGELRVLGMNLPIGVKVVVGPEALVQDLKSVSYDLDVLCFRLVKEVHQKVNHWERQRVVIGTPVAIVEDVLQQAHHRKVIRADGKFL